MCIIYISLFNQVRRKFTNRAKITNKIFLHVFSLPTFTGTGRDVGAEERQAPRPKYFLN
jgi:hypothetical protein